MCFSLLVPALDYNISKFRDQNVIETWACASSVFHGNKLSFKILQNDGIVTITAVFNGLG